VAELSLEAEIRDDRGKNAARKLRAGGKVPGTLYGRGIDPVAVAVDARTLLHTLSTDAGSNVLIDLHIGGQAHLTLAREVARNPVRGDILHVDFLKIAHNVAIHVEVPIHLEGEAPGVKEGGVLEHHLWQLSVECLPGNVPERLNLDISEMRVGDALRVSHVVVPEGVTILTDPEEILVTCVVPQLRTEPELEEAATEVAEGEAVPAEGAAPAEGGGEGGEG